MADVFVGMEVDADLAPPLLRGRGLLLDASRDLGDQTVVDGINRLGAGITWMPWGALETLDGSGVNCATVFNKTPRTLPNLVDQHGFALWHSLQCGAGSNWASVLSQRVDFNMQLLRSASFAYELESGALTGDNSLASTAEVVSATATSLLTAIVALENHFATVQPGARGTIHLTPGLLVRALAEGIVEYRDGQYRTATDTVVIGDAGHTGQVEPADVEASAPGADEAWIYISGDIWVAQLEPKRPDPTGDNVGEFVLLRNTDRPLSEMWGLITFDPDIVGAALVSTADAAAGGGGGDATAANQTTANTRLQEIEDRIEALVTATGDLDANLEAIETLLTSLVTNVGDLDVNQEAQETLLTAISNFFNTAPTNATSAALVNTAVVKASAGTVYGISGYADAAGFVTIHNKASAPANTDVPVLAIPVESGKAWSVDFGLRGRAFSTGISLGFSSTGPTFTSGAGSHATYDAQYV